MKDNSLEVDTDYILQQIKLAMKKLLDIDFYNTKDREIKQRKLNEAYFILDNLKIKIQKERK